MRIEALHRLGNAPRPALPDEVLPLRSELREAPQGGAAPTPTGKLLVSSDFLGGDRKALRRTVRSTRSVSPTPDGRRRHCL
jgi:hypothetical protein